ncbi:MAG: hypothetical protein JOY86_07665, partial [Candidatus Eremiobacteraeota bacterium]|nr:hypothetical protein [Candidatus Eremiobacteraeota bacterium]
MGFAKRFPQRVYRDKYMRGKILARLSSESDADQSLTRVSAKRVTGANASGYSAVEIPQGADPEAFAENLRGQAGIADAKPIVALYTQNETIPNDPFFGLNSQICVGPQTTPVQWDMYVTWMPEAWFSQMGTGVKIAIIDTGVDLTNNDVAPNVILADNAVF